MLRLRQKRWHPAPVHGSFVVGLDRAMHSRILVHVPRGRVAERLLRSTTKLHHHLEELHHHHLHYLVSKVSYIVDSVNTSIELVVAK